MTNEELLAAGIVFVIEPEETTINDDGSITIIATMLPSDVAPELIRCGLQLIEDSEAAQ